MKFATVNDFFDLVSAALTAGAMFGLWLGMDPLRLGPAVYVAQQQQLVRGMNVAMPLLGAATIVLTSVSAFEAVGEHTRLMLLLATAGCYVIAGLITRFRNQPINAVVMTWSMEAPPADWASWRDRWWRWHVRRMVFGVAGLCLLLLATLNRAKGG